MKSFEEFRAELSKLEELDESRGIRLPGGRGGRNAGGRNAGGRNAGGRNQGGRNQGGRNQGGRNQGGRNQRPGGRGPSVGDVVDAVTAPIRWGAAGLKNLGGAALSAAGGQVGNLIRGKEGSIGSVHGKEHKGLPKVS